MTVLEKKNIFFRDFNRFFLLFLKLTPMRFRGDDKKGIEQETLTNVDGT
jgi:hypothetical protein